MNKHELIETLEDLNERSKEHIKTGVHEGFWRGKADSYVNAIGLVKQLDEPRITDEQAWNKIAEAYPRSAQSLRNTLDNAVFWQG